MATRLETQGGGEEDIASDYIAQIFERVKVTFSAEERCIGPIPINTPSFVENLQTQCGVTITCESKYSNKGVQKPAQFVLEGTLAQINRARTFLANWVKGGEDIDSQVSAEQGSSAGQDSRNSRKRYGEADSVRETGPSGQGHSERRDVGGRDGDQRERQIGREPNQTIGGATGGRSEHDAAALVTSTNSQDTGSRRGTGVSRYTGGSHEMANNYDGRPGTGGNGEDHINHRNPQSRHGHDPRDSREASSSDITPGDYQQTSGIDVGRVTTVTRDGGRGSSNTSSQHSERLTSSATPMSGVNGIVQADNGNGQNMSDSLRQNRSQQRRGAGQDRHSNNHGRHQNGLEDQDDQRHPNGRTSPSLGSRGASARPGDGATTPSNAHEDPNNNLEGATSGTPLDGQVEGASSKPPDGQDSNSYVPVDAGVFAYILKMYGPNIKSLESRYSVKITADDVNESSMVTITPVGRSGESSIREANEAVVDLYSTVFSTLSHRVIDLEETAITSDALGRVIADSKRMYKDVLVIVSGNKLMIYGAKELDVKVVKAMVTNRVYDASKRSANSYQDRRDERTDDILLAERGLASGQGTVDYLAGSQGTQNLNRSVERSHSSAHGAEDDLDRGQHPEMFPGQPERSERSDVHHIDTGQSSAALKYRLKHDKLSYKTTEGLKVHVYQGDITKEKIGAIVNAANESLLHAGGVAGAISKAAGTMMMLECSQYITKHGRLYPSQVMWTSSGNLPCQFVIHAVGPRWGEYKNKTECFETLKMTFIRCLEVAEKDLMVAGIAMPIISSGIFGVPVSQCVDALYEAISEFSRSWDPATNVLKEIRILEIEADSVKVIQGQLIGKLTGDGRGAVVRHTGNHSNHNDDARVDEDDSSGRHQEDVGDDTEERRRMGSAGADSLLAGASGLGCHRGTDAEHHGAGASGLGHQRTVDLEHHGAGSVSGLLDRRSERADTEKVDDLFNTNRTGKTHQTNVLYPNLAEHFPDETTDRRIPVNRKTEFEELSRFTEDPSGNRYSSLPNLSGRGRSTDVLPGNYRTTTGSSTSSRFDADVTSRMPTTTYEASYGRLGVDSRGNQRVSDSLTSQSGISYLGAEGGASPRGATGGEEETNESLIQTILNQHENSRQSANQIEETSKLLNRLLGKDPNPSSGRSREKGHRSSRRTQSLDRSSKKTKDRDFQLDTYDLSSEIKGTNRDDFENKKCTVCFSRRDLTQRKDCEHMTCRSCYRIGLYKGQCSLCKIKNKSQRSTSSHSVPSSSEREPRSRSRVKKVTPDTKPLHGHSNYRPRSSATAGGAHHRGGPMVALSTPPLTSPEWDSSEASAAAAAHLTTNPRLDPVGGATDPRRHSRDRQRGEDGIGGERGRERQRRDVLPGSNGAKIEAWMDNSESGSRNKMYSHTDYTDPEIGHESSTSSRNSREGGGGGGARRRRHQDDEDQSREKGGGGGTGGNGGARYMSPGLAPHQNQKSTKRDGRGRERDVATASTTCPICMDAIQDPKMLNKCKHTFCASCIDKALKVKSVCPICGVVYGQLYGNQPAGTMTNYVEPTDLPGYEGCGTIVISYRFPDGVQNEDHSNPDQPFRGTARMAYLPNNIEGQQVFRLLEKAFKARLIFTIGQSVTTGEQNTVVWNDIHHKTRRTGGAENHGYPDLDYLRRVKEELSAKGIK